MKNQMRWKITLIGMILLLLPSLLLGESNYLTEEDINKFKSHVFISTILTYKLDKVSSLFHIIKDDTIYIFAKMDLNMETEKIDMVMDEDKIISLGQISFTNKKMMIDTGMGKIEREFITKGFTNQSNDEQYIFKSIEGGKPRLYIFSIFQKL
jgi:hypothetical protein